MEGSYESKLELHLAWRQLIVRAVNRWPPEVAVDRAARDAAFADAIDAMVLEHRIPFWQVSKRIERLVNLQFVRRFAEIGDLEGTLKCAARLNLDLGTITALHELIYGEGRAYTPFPAFTD